jgi:hypothetical protein
MSAILAVVVRRIELGTSEDLVGEQESREVLYKGLKILSVDPEGNL